MSDNIVEYSFLINQEGNKIQVLEEFKINYPIIAVNYYPDLKEVYNKLIEKKFRKNSFRKNIKDNTLILKCISKNKIQTNLTIKK